MRFGNENEKGLRLNTKSFRLEVVTIGQAASDGHVIEEGDLLVHDETNWSLASMLSSLPFPDYPVVLGILYRQERPTYDGTLRAQMLEAQKKPGDLDALLQSGATWTVE
jgi:2-oxoglutarate ferredoxin oxidoreductase subunit beta